MARTEEQTKDSKAGLIAHILVSIVFMALGIVMLVVDPSIISTIVYSFSVLVAGILFICFGAYYMIKYFFNQEFRKISNYGFTMGVILVIIGAVLIFMAADLSVFIDSIVCLVGIVLGAVMIQQAFALFHIERSSWFVSLIFAVATIGVSIYFLISSQKFFSGDLLSCVYLISVGALSIICLLMMVFGLKDHKKISEKIYKRNLEEAPATAHKSDDDSIFEEEPVTETTSEPEPETPVTDDTVFEEQ